ncbi:unnamed protein product [Citrullus colocynthis]|uniref:Uncharacterized protein n=1 Tax=Citrullus colocynthis TaxID=252529 RepID=A0ABP0Y2W3_9ROSI
MIDKLIIQTCKVVVEQLLLFVTHNYAREYSQIAMIFEPITGNSIGAPEGSHRNEYSLLHPNIATEKKSTTKHTQQSIEELNVM